MKVEIKGSEREGSHHRPERLDRGCGMNNLTAESVTSEIKSLVGSWLKAKAYADVTRNKIDAIHRQILQEKPVFSDDGIQLLLAKDLYLSSDDEACKRFYDEADVRCKAQGYNNLKPGQCPALIAEDMLRKIEWAIFDAWEPVLGVEDLQHRTLCLGIDKYKWFIDLTVKLVISLPGFKKPKLAINPQTP